MNTTKKNSKQIHMQIKYIVQMQIKYTVHISRPHKYVVQMQIKWKTKSHDLSGKS